MTTYLRYSASDCFETFPFPAPDPRTVLPALESAGDALYEARARFMVETDQGLTKTYNALKDPACTDPRVLALLSRVVEWPSTAAARLLRLVSVRVIQLGLPRSG